MSWNDVTQTASRPQYLPGAVSVQSSAGRGRARMTVTFRPEMIGPRADWIVPGARYKLFFGTEEHAGLIRLQRADNGRKLAFSGGRRVARPMLILLGYDWIPNVRHKTETAAHTAGSDWIEIVLPKWATTRHAAPPPQEEPPDVVEAPPLSPVVGVKPAAPPRTLPSTPAPPRGVSFVDHIPDPVAARRRGQSPIAQTPR